ncbi:hypothetical protein B0H14DRAFT_3133936 [Mycena olivaceomarginata]|nr:hypothetical protein B0H14DRAFT_3133936 [Mycena olivaceomarginata]
MTCIIASSSIGTGLDRPRLLACTRDWQGTRYLRSAVASLPPPPIQLPSRWCPSAAKEVVIVMNWRRGTAGTSLERNRFFALEKARTCQTRQNGLSTLLNLAEPATIPMYLARQFIAISPQNRQSRLAFHTLIMHSASWREHTYAVARVPPGGATIPSTASTAHEPDVANGDSVALLTEGGWERGSWDLDSDGVNPRRSWSGEAGLGCPVTVLRVGG